MHAKKYSEYGTSGVIRASALLQKVSSLKICRECYRFFYGNTWNAHAPLRDSHNARQKVDVHFTTCIDCRDKVGVTKFDLPALNILAEAKRKTQICHGYVASNGKFFCECDFINTETAMKSKESAKSSRRDIIRNNKNK